MTLWQVVTAAAAAAAVLEVAARWWIRRYAGYYVWLPGMRLELRQQADAFAGVEARVRFEVNADGERGGGGGADRHGLRRTLLAGGDPPPCPQNGKGHHRTPA